MIIDEVDAASAVFLCSKLDPEAGSLEILSQTILVLLVNHLGAATNQVNYAVTVDYPCHINLAKALPCFPSL